MTLEAQKKYEVYDDKRETSQNNKQGAETEIGCGEGNCQQGSSVKIVVENFTINVFFDGTGNNAHNTEFRLLDEEYKAYLTEYETILSREEKYKLTQAQIDKKSWLETEMGRYQAEKEYTNYAYLRNQVSYMNEFSNVALLHLNSKDRSTEYSNIYIQGAGTSKTELDDTDGLGFAKGPTGVYARVNLAFDGLNKVVKKFKAHRYTINVFGFSRGAFYARVFCAWLKENSFLSENIRLNPEYEEIVKSQVETKNLRHIYLEEPADSFTLNLVGIYDTVSSYAMFRHYSDLKEFSIDITPKKQGIVKLVHFTAQNEYRQHFPLTKIQTALDEVSANNDSLQVGSEGSAIELSFPGAHSNIGGAYTDVWIERDHYLSIIDPKSKQPRYHGEIHWKWWVDKGYYLEDSELKINNEWIGKKQKISYVATRGVRNYYQYIMFDAMKTVIKKFAKIITFNDDEERVKQRVDIFKKAKQGIDSNENLVPNPETGDEIKEVDLYQKNLTEKRVRVLKTMSEEIDSFIKKHIAKNGNFNFDLKEVLPSQEDRNTLFNTYICNSLQPKEHFSVGKDDTDIYVEDYVAPEAKHKYDVPLKKETNTIQGLTLPGVANEGNMKNRIVKNGITTVVRPTVKGG